MNGLSVRLAPMLGAGVLAFVASELVAGRAILAVVAAICGAAAVARVRTRSRSIALAWLGIAAASFALWVLLFVAPVQTIGGRPLCGTSTVAGVTRAVPCP